MAYVHSRWLVHISTGHAHCLSQRLCLCGYVLWTSAYVHYTYTIRWI